MRKPSIFFPIIDNGIGISRTSWAQSMFMLGLSNALKDRTVYTSRISYPYPDGAMNIASANFLESPADEMLIIDTDEIFEPRDVELLLSSNVEFVGGMYPKKEVLLSFPIMPLDEKATFAETFPDVMKEGDSPLVEVACVARGFLRLKRSVFEKLASHCQEYREEETGRMQRLFWKGCLGGHSEDFAFCDLWRSIGGKVYVDNRVRVKHEGSAVYPITL